MTKNRLAECAALLIAATATNVAAQTAEKPLDPAALRRSSFTWTQAEREYGFAHWDAIFPESHLVKRGSRVRALPEGRPLGAFAPGAPRANDLARFIIDQNVAGLIVLQDGAVRLERYALGYSAAGRWVSQSVAKAVTSTLVGAAIKDGFIGSLDDPVTKYVVGLRGSAYDGVSIRHLITMTSGVKWNEDYADPGSDLAHFYADYVPPGANRTVSYLRKLPREAPPGTKWLYKTGETHLLGLLVISAIKRPLADYLSEKIWQPYGMEQSATWMTDPTNDELAGCCLQAGLRDFARFGQFVLEGGRIDGRSVVPDGWFEAATRRQVATTVPGRGYGYQWWTEDDGTFDAIGIHGQLIHIDRVRRLVVAMNSAWPVAVGTDRSAARLQFLQMINAAVDAEPAPPKNE